MKKTPGFLGLTTFEVIDDPDKIVEIAEWASLSARELWMAGAMHSGDLKPLLDSLAAPFRAINIRTLW
jgi:heme-degrading monooxygenase HmoA